MTFWRGLLGAAAMFNFLAGLPLLLVPAMMLRHLGIAVPAELLFHRLAGLLIICVGAVLVFNAHDLQRYRPLLWIAVSGKLAVVVLFGQAWLAGTVPTRAFGVALGDLMFAALFVVFLLTYPKATAPRPAV